MEKCECVRRQCLGMSAAVLHQRQLRCVVVMEKQPVVMHKSWGGLYFCPCQLVYAKCGNDCLYFHWLEDRRSLTSYTVSLSGIWKLILLLFDTFAEGVSFPPRAKVSEEVRDAWSRRRPLTSWIHSAARQLKSSTCYMHFCCVLSTLIHTFSSCPLPFNLFPDFLLFSSAAWTGKGSIFLGCSGESYTGCCAQTPPSEPPSQEHHPVPRRW